MVDENGNSYIEHPSGLLIPALTKRNGILMPDALAREIDREEAQQWQIHCSPGDSVLLPNGQVAHAVRVYTDGTVIAPDQVLGRQFDMGGVISSTDLEAPIDL